MKSIILKLVGIVSFTVSSSFVSDYSDTATLTVHVDKLRNANGLVQFALYNREDTLPDEHFEKFYKIAVAPIENRAASIVFEDLPPGVYAVNILHDENENGQIDRRFLLPKEGIGFSNYESIGITNKPTFSKASFELKGDKDIVVKVIYL